MTPEEQIAADLKAAAGKASIAKLPAANIARVIAESVAKPPAVNVVAAEPLVIEGDEKNGGPFTINGEGFGEKGTMTVGGHAVKVTSWTDKRIKGTLPKDVTGEVLLVTPVGARSGRWPNVKKA